MSGPGEVSQEIGKAYVKVLVGSLERTISEFSQVFDVYNNPEKLSFANAEGKSYSFDASGYFSHPMKSCEVFIESKGYQVGATLMDDYRSFIAKAYVTKVLNSRHNKDLFWFVTNVPFGSSYGKKLVSYKFIFDSLKELSQKGNNSILLKMPIDENKVTEICNNIGLCIITDSHIKLMGVSYLVKKGENVWSIIKLIHGNIIPKSYFEPIAKEVERLNGLEDANKIKHGEKLIFPWYGIDIN